MSLYDIYLERKAENKERICIFKVGNFYTFLGDDAKLMSEELDLKLVKFSNTTNKCGFPLSKISFYKKIIHVLGFEFIIIMKSTDWVINDINHLNIQELSENKAKDKLKLYQEILQVEWYNDDGN